MNDEFYTDGYSDGRDGKRDNAETIFMTWGRAAAEAYRRGYQDAQNDLASDAPVD